MQTQTVTLIDRRIIASEVISLVFSRPEDFTFAAGQFVQFLIPEQEKQTPRSYSIASTPSDNYLEFCVKLLDGGLASRYFQSMSIGQTIALRGPRGRFICPNGAAAHYFVATGAGLAPIMGIIRDELENKKTDKEIRLLFGVRTDEDIFWNDRLEALAKKYDLFSYDITLSQPRPDNGWRGLRGRVTDHLLHHLVEHDYYLCGSAQMVKDVRDQVIKNGVPAERVHFEIF